MKLFRILLLLLLVGCKTEIGRTAIGTPYVEEVEVSCTYAGYCFTCMPGFDGKFNCGAKFSALCPGSRLIKQQVIVFEIQYDNGSTHRIEYPKEIEEIKGCS